MASTVSRQALIEFLGYLAQKGLMASATIQARKAAVNAVLGILSEEEAKDVTRIDLDEVMARFMNLQGREYNPQSLATYKSRVRAALEDFTRYIENPLGFKPNVQARERKPNQNKTPSNKAPVALPAEPSQNSSPPVITGPMAKSILPIPIRADLTVYIQGLPFDLTESEAKRISNVVTAMAMIT
jgi:hypothetical protein